MQAVWKKEKSADLTKGGLQHHPGNSLNPEKYLAMKYTNQHHLITIGISLCKSSDIHKILNYDLLVFIHVPGAKKTTEIFRYTLPT